LGDFGIFLDLGCLEQLLSVETAGALSEIWYGRIHYPDEKLFTIRLIMGTWWLSGMTVVEGITRWQAIFLI